MTTEGIRTGMMAAAMVVAACSSTRAQPPPPEPRSHTLTLDAKLQKVVVEKSSVASALILSPTRLKLVEKGVGQTHVWLFLAGKDGGVEGEVRAYKVTVDPNELQVAEAPDAPLPRRGTARTRETRGAAGAVQQVRTKVRILEASKAALGELSVKWGAASLVETHAGPRTGALMTAKRPAGDGIGGYAALLDQLEELEEKGELRTLSAPDLLAVAGTEAELIIGGQVPIPITKGKAGDQAEGDGQTAEVEYRNFGLTISVTPEVSKGGHIRVQLRAEVATLDFANGLAVNGKQLPAFRTRQVTDSAFFRSGDTLVLAGLLTRGEIEALKEPSAADDIPPLGGLGGVFSKERFHKSETELVILVTPAIAEQGATAEVAKQ